MMTFIYTLIAGFGGGVVRGLMGFLKSWTGYSTRSSFSPLYFFLVAFVSGIVGLLTAVAIKESVITLGGVSYISPALAFIIGYAGGDFLEGAYKLLVKKVKIEKE